MRGIAYRRAQQKRMIQRSLKVEFLNGFRSYIENMEAYIAAKKRANNLAQCSCEMCSGHKRGPFAVPTLARLRSDAAMEYQVAEIYDNDVLTRQQLEDTRMNMTLRERYENYLAHADDGTGHEKGTGLLLKSFDEWLNS